MAGTTSATASALSLKPYQLPDAFSRQDESDDRLFYSRDRFVAHLDTAALNTVGRIIGGLITEKNPVLLDLMAGWDSHLPSGLAADRVVGLGLNENELAENARLTEKVIHDLNGDPHLPFPERTFDAVINTVSVDYLTRPIEVFREVNRILKPGGLFLVIFSNRLFPQKAVKIWQESNEEERVLLVEDFFREAGGYEGPQVFISRGQPRPSEDKYAYLGIPSDPVYAVYAERQGGDPNKKRRTVDMTPEFKKMTPEELKELEKNIKHTLCCPYCGEKMLKWAVPENPFCQTWDNDYMYICFNDACSYYVRGWNHMAKEVQKSVSYRLMYNPERDYCLPIPVPTPFALREGIIE